ncbi:MAG TPA: glycosyltransferase family 39 protein, partial [Pirellulales bacterium]|nr:glycosyltransferase family 39 protein [Pirellulales bacterium]
MLRKAEALGMRIAVCALLIGHALLVVLTAWRCSPTRDEPAHLAAGISHWRFGDFSLYRVNPPLVRMLAALPVLLAGADEDWSAFSDRRLARAEFPVGSALVAANGPRSAWLVFLARLACLPFSLIGAGVCFRWAREMHGGAPAGLMALALWCFCPIVLGHAALLTPDVAAASLGAAACYLFWRWLKKPAWGAALAAGGAMGLAELTKFTWLVLFVVWPLAAAVWLWTSPRGGAAEGTDLRVSSDTVGRTRWAMPTLQLVTMFLLAAYVINFGYAFQATGAPLGDYRFVSQAFKGPSLGGDAQLYSRHNRFAGTWLGSFRVPMPRDYLLGIDVQRRDFEGRIPTFYHGAWREAAPWYAYFYALAIKLPLGTLGLMALATFLTIWHRGVGCLNRNELALLGPAATVLIVACACTGLGSQVRYVLPALPFIFVWTGQSASSMFRERRSLRWLGAGVLLWSAVATLANHPCHLAYFNELSSVPSAAPPPLLDSNLDWGQDLLYLRDWSKANPGARPLYLAYYGSFDPADVGIDAAPAEIRRQGKSRATRPAPGWYAISIGRLWDRSDTLAY